MFDAAGQHFRDPHDLHVQGFRCAAGHVGCATVGATASGACRLMFRRGRHSFVRKRIIAPKRTLLLSLDRWFISAIHLPHGAAVVLVVVETVEVVVVVGVVVVVEEVVLAVVVVVPVVVPGRVVVPVVVVACEVVVLRVPVTPSVVVWPVVVRALVVV